MAIQSFADKNAEVFFITGRLAKGAGWRGVAKIVRRKLDMLHYATSVNDLRSPPGNRLEVLKGEWRNCYSMRINDQWRIIFQWSEQGPEHVRVIDYH